ncbi:MAG: hypothetical protein R3D33_08075 [Hyphomicrobiaceae bacterium]
MADSLGAPLHLPFSFALVRDHVARMVAVGDDAIKDCIGSMFRDLKVAAEPAPAAGLAALIGPLREELAGRHVVLLVCGANIDETTFARYLAGAAAGA